MAHDDHPVIPTDPPRVPAPGEPGPQALSWSRKIAALVIALIADAPPVCLLSEAYPLVFDLAIAGVLWLVLGRSKLLAMALLIECIPGVGLAPTWTLYVLWEIIVRKPGPPKPVPPVISKTKE